MQVAQAIVDTRPLLSAGVREVKSRFSDYLKDIEHGSHVFVTNRGRVVAEIRPVHSAMYAPSAPEILLADKGALRIPLLAARKPLPATGMQCSTPHLSQSLLDAERGG